MPRHTLFAYVDGSDLDDIADALEGRLRAFVEARSWIAGEAWVVNQQLEADASCTEPEDIPCWDLGLNLHLPDPGIEPAGWFADVEAIAPSSATCTESSAGISSSALATPKPALPRTCTALPTARLTWKCWHG